MNDEFPEPLYLDGIDFSHQRLVDLAKLADQAEPFYRWIEKRFQAALGNNLSLDEFLRQLTIEEISNGIRACYYADKSTDIPILFDGIGRSYSHVQAYYYYFSWLIRDAPRQRLGPLIQRLMRLTGGSSH